MSSLVGLRGIKKERLLGEGNLGERVPGPDGGLLNALAD